MDVVRGYQCKDVLIHLEILKLSDLYNLLQNITIFRIKGAPNYVIDICNVNVIQSVVKHVPKYNANLIMRLHNEKTARPNIKLIVFQNIENQVRPV